MLEVELPVLVLRCSDLRGAPTGDLCTSDELSLSGAERVVICCRRGTIRRRQLFAAARRAGVHPSGVRIVSGAPGDVEVLIEAAVADLAQADLEEAVHEREEPVPARRSRRSFLHLEGRSRQAVAFHRDDRCTGRCRAWTSTCPSGALSASSAGTTSVDPTACTGCGACLASGCLSLNGVSLAGLEAAAEVLAGEAAARGSGVTVQCRHAEPEATGGRWLPLVVPSLEMVTPGWIAGLRGLDVAVTVMPCRECGPVGPDVSEVLGAVTPSASMSAFSLRQPLAGDIDILTAACTGCGNCARACPTGALSLNLSRLEFSASSCTGCGLCVDACPEQAVMLTRGPGIPDRRVVAGIGEAGRCRTCGGPLAGGLSATRIAARLAQSHPELARQLLDRSVCPDCALRDSPWPVTT